MKLKRLLIAFTTACTVWGCQPEKSTMPDIHLITLDPGHFHAALVQKTMYAGIDSNVYVYAPDSPDLQFHLERINRYNQRTEDPTHWNSLVYAGEDFFTKMIADKKGNVVVLAGNNQLKTEYILRSIKEGFNVLADKPMAINTEDYQLLEEAFQLAKEKNLLLYDIMTERFEITTMLQKAFSQVPEIFGELEKGSPEHPSVTKESVHHFYKYVSGSVLTRPAWFFDVEQEGEGLVDVMTHLVDMVQWECFPGKTIDIDKDIQIDRVSRFPTLLSKSQFEKVTGEKAFPHYLLNEVTNDTTLNVYCNGEINYRLAGIHAKVSVKWAYKAPEGTGDTHYSIMRGTLANLEIRQGEEQQYKPALYIVPVNKQADFESTLKKYAKQISDQYPGIEFKPEGNEWRVLIPEQYAEGHEAHFARVTEKYIEYLRKDNIPDWEVPNMLAKYYLTTKALEMAKRESSPEI